MLMKTSELSGAALDWAVAKCSGMPFFTMGEDWPGNYNVTVMAGEKPVLIYDLTGRMWREHQGVTVPWSPSADWAQGGPLWDEWATSMEHYDGWLVAVVGGGDAQGPTKLISLCRAIVAAKFGDTVEVPDDLLSAPL